MAWRGHHRRQRTAQRILVWDASREALPVQHTQLNLGHMQLTAIDGGVVEFQPILDLPGLRQGGCAARGRRMRAQGMSRPDAEGQV